MLTGNPDIEKMHPYTHSVGEATRKDCAPSGAILFFQSNIKVWEVMTTTKIFSSLNGQMYGYIEINYCFRCDCFIFAYLIRWLWRHLLKMATFMTQFSIFLKPNNFLISWQILISIHQTAQLDKSLFDNMFVICSVVSFEWTDMNPCITCEMRPVRIAAYLD